MLPCSVAQALAEARDRGIARLDAQWMLARLLGQPRSWLVAHDDATLDAGQLAQLRAWLARSCAGEPLAYLFGETEFHGLMLNVSAAVLIPRPDTETLVDWALQLLREDLHGVAAPQVLDLGTGSGAIALAVKHAHPAAQVTALDASDAALAVARANALRHRLDIGLTHSDWWHAMAGRRFDLVLSNPPYIAEDDAHLPALHHEPQAALRAGPDGLADLRRVAQGAPAHLQPGAWLLLEHGHAQSAAVQALLLQHGFADVQTRRDLAGQMRCTGGRMAPPR